MPEWDRDGEPVAYLVTELVPGEALSSMLATPVASGSFLTVRNPGRLHTRTPAAHL